MNSKKLFMDVHEVGRGNVNAEALAGAHQKDVETAAKYGADFQAYWFDEANGKVFCLVEAESADVVNKVHGEAHGLLAQKVMEVTADNTNWMPTPGKKLFMDVHNLGAGNVNAEAVAGAHQKDLEIQGNHDAKYINYWFDKDSGTVMCLIEAPNAEAAVAGHKEAHGLIPDQIVEVSEGR